MRVNVIHPKYLADQHLVAEYREIKMGQKPYQKVYILKMVLIKIE